MDGGYLDLRFDKVKTYQKEYTGGLLQSKAPNYVYLYGKFTSRLKASSQRGMVNAFWLYKWQAANQRPEVDVEMGRQANSGAGATYLTVHPGDGIKAHDVSNSFGADFDWHVHTIWLHSPPDKRIEFCVDDVNCWTAPASTALISIPLSIMFELWGYKPNNWLGPFADPGQSVHMLVDWVKYEPLP